MFRFTAAFQDWGDFFTDMGPGVFPRDASVLEFRNNVALVCDGLHTLSPEACNVLNPARSLGPRSPNEGKARV